MRLSRSCRTSLRIGRGRPQRARSAGLRHSIGVSIVANKVPGIRCALVHDVTTARLAREHNNAQALALGARVVDIPTALAMVDAWMAATFQVRHQCRLDKIAAREGCALPTKP